MNSFPASVRRARHLLILVVALVAVLSLAFMAACSNESSSGRQTSNSASSKSAPKRGPLAPNFTLRSLDGETVELSSLRGDVVVIDFWATWCPPCRITLPLVNKVYKETRGENVKVFGISTDRVSSAKVRDFLQQNNMELPVLHDRDGTVARAYGVRAIPTTLVIGKYGCIRDRHLGADRLIDKKLLEKVNELLKE